MKTLLRTLPRLLAMVCALGLLPVCVWAQTGVQNDALRLLEHHGTDFTSEQVLENLLNLSPVHPRRCAPSPLRASVMRKLAPCSL